MAAFLLLVPLLLLGTAAEQPQAEIKECLWLQNVTEGNFSVEIIPETYQANKTFVVMIKDNRNRSSSSGPYLLQALSPQNASLGRWKEAHTENCSSTVTAILNSTQNTANWTSPNSSLPYVQIRVYFRISDNTTELKTFMLNRGVETTTLRPTTTLPLITTPNSVSRAQSSSWILAALQLPLLLLTGSLLS